MTYQGGWDSIAAWHFRWLGLLQQTQGMGAETCACPWATKEIYPGLSAEDAHPAAAGSLHTANTFCSPSQGCSKVNALRGACWVSFYNIHLLGAEGRGPQLPATVITLFPAPCQLYFIFFLFLSVKASLTSH